MSNPNAIAPSAVLADPRTNRGRRFGATERDALGLHGRVPPSAPLTLAQDVSRVLLKLSRTPGDGDAGEIARYELLMHILERDETLFFATAQRNLREILPMIYTPAVGTACLNYSSLAVAPRGLWIGIDRAGSIREILETWTSAVDVIVVTDGERILGLGDLGVNGHPIPVGKLLLYSACGGIDPARCLPITLDVGCDVESIRGDEYYIGLGQKRVRGEKYDAFIQEFMDAVVARFGSNCLVQFEDFGNSNALRLLEKYKDRICCFNDDIQGTAAVGLAGILSALRIPGVPSNLADHTFLFYGAGSAGIGIASLIVQELVRQGVPEDAARKHCYFIDSRGLIYAGRENVSSAKAPFAHEIDDDLRSIAKQGIAAIVEKLQPTGLIGVSTIRGAFDEAALTAMSRLNARPLIFALSNPTAKSECTARAAYEASDGRAVFASGSPFDPVRLEGSDRTLVPGQGNNAFVFPGIGLGVLAAGARRVSDRMILAGARRLAELVSDEQLNASCVYPPLEELLDISAEIAYAVALQAKEDDVASKNLNKINVASIRKSMYTPAYEEE